MTIQDLGALGELLGSVAVLATLVYLACDTVLTLSLPSDWSRIRHCSEAPQHL